MEREEGVESEGRGSVSDDVCIDVAAVGMLLLLLLTPMSLLLTLLSTAKTL